MKQFFTGLLFLLILTPSLVVADEFEVLDIRIEGLQRVSAGTVFASLPLSVGATVDEAIIREATRS